MSSTKKEYKLVSGSTPHFLDTAVAELLAKGWDLYGHPFYATSEGTNKFCQAMIKEAEPTGHYSLG